MENTNYAIGDEVNYSEIQNYLVQVKEPSSLISRVIFVLTVAVVIIAVVIIVIVIILTVSSGELILKS